MKEGKKMSSPVQSFYEKSNVLITGGTGFLGKALIQKLLSACPEIEGIYLTVRHKKGVQPAERVKLLFENPIFDALRANYHDIREKVFAIEADLSQPGLGLSESDGYLLREKIDIVFQCAGHLNMTASLKEATAVNAKGPAEVIELCKTMKKLKSAVMVSTVYSCCTQDVIREEFIDFPINIPVLTAFVDEIDERLVEKVTPILLDPWPNTYVFTKAMGESIVAKSAGDLPVGLFRPSIVTGTYQDPIPGWTDNIYGPIGIMVASGLGFYRVLLSKPEVKADIVPADFCVNAMICAAYEISQRKKINAKADIPVYNFSSGDNWNISWEDYVNVGAKCYSKPSLKAIWPQFMFVVYSMWSFRILHILLHYVPGHIVDAMLKIGGGKPKLIPLYKKVDKSLNVLIYFLTHGWQMTNHNVVQLWKSLEKTDRQLFPFDMSTIEFEEYMKRVTEGVRLHILKETDEDVPRARKRYRRLVIAHKITVGILSAVAILIFYSLLSRLFRMF